MFGSIYSLFFLVFCFWAISKWNFFRSSKIPVGQLYFFFTLQLLFSVLLYYIYTEFYPIRKDADIFKFFDDAQFLYSSLFHTSPWDYIKLIFGAPVSSSVEDVLHETSYWFKPFETALYNDNRTVIRINAFIRLFSFGIYPIHALIFCFLSFIGFVSIYKTFMCHFVKSLTLLKVACFLIPSSLLWCSGVLKESILIFALGLFVFKFVSFTQTKRISVADFTLILLSLFLLKLIKSYILILLLPGILTFLLIGTGFFKKPIYAFLSVHLLGFLFLIIIRIPFPSVDFVHIIYKMQFDFLNVASETGASSVYNITRLSDSLFSLISMAPEAIFNVFFRPFFDKPLTPLIIFASFENVTITSLVATWMFFRRKGSSTLSPAGYMLLSFSLLSILLIGLTVPVTGAIVRYKAPLLPFFIILLFMSIDFQLISQFKYKILKTWKKN